MYRGWIILAAFLALLTPALTAAQVDLRFAPSDTTIEAGQTLRVSIMLDQPLDFRTIDVVVMYDTTVVRSLGGGEGLLYTGSGLPTYPGFEEDSLGQWHGYSTILAAGQYAQGPGEIFYWDVEGLVDGVSPITSITVALSSPPDGYTWYEDVQLPPTTITVGDVSSVGEIQPLKTGLKLWPNPFNPRVHVGFDLVATDWIRLEVCDVRGRRVAVLHDGTAPAGPFEAAWDGKNDVGQSQPGGVYLFRLRHSRGGATTRGVLLK